MNPLRRDLLPLATILLAFAASYLAYDHLPQQVPIHWGAGGRIDTYAPKRWGIYRYPGFMVLIYLFFRLLLPYADRRRIGQMREIGIYEPFRHAAVLLFGYAHALSLCIGLGWASSGANYLVGSAGILFLFAVDYARRHRPPGLCRLLRRFGISPSPLALGHICRGLTLAGICGILGPLTGRAQVGWLLLPILLTLILARRRFPIEEGSPA